jgi:DNA invertase Pin-like site-specific DNA recombinase
MIAAIYARKSTEQNGVGDEEKSVTRQIEHAKAYATKKGWAGFSPRNGTGLKPQRARGRA